MGPAAEAVADMCAVTRHRQDAYACRSHALSLAAARAGAFDADVVLAGGAESASTAPWRLARPTTSTGLPMAYERAPFAPSEIGDPDMGPAAEAVADMCAVTRHRQ